MLWEFPPSNSGRYFLLILFFSCQSAIISRGWEMHWEMCAILFSGCRTAVDWSWRESRVFSSIDMGVSASNRLWGPGPRSCSKHRARLLSPVALGLPGAEDSRAAGVLCCLDSSVSVCSPGALVQTFMLRLFPRRDLRR